MNRDIAGKEFRKDIGEALWKARREKKLLVSKVADDLGEKQRDIELIEMGRIFEYRLIRKLAKYYKKDLKFVFE